jgi:hypothetical protein
VRFHEGPQPREQWNGANDFVFFAKRGELASNRSDDHVTSILCLHLIQNAVCINTLMMQQVLERPHWTDRLTAVGEVAANQRTSLDACSGGATRRARWLRPFDQILGAYAFEPFDEVVDVGGGRGTSLALVYIRSIVDAGRPATEFAGDLNRTCCDLSLTSQEEDDLVRIMKTLTDDYHRE